MTIKVGINGFGRIGRLVLRASLQWDDIEFVHINDPAGDAATFAHLLEFDSVHGRLPEGERPEMGISFQGNLILIKHHSISFSENKNIADTDWSTCDVVIDASGKMKTSALLNEYLEQGVKRVVVTAPVNEEGILNIVMGVNHQLYDKNKHGIVTAASCTTNCMAPVIKVIQEKLGIKHGAITTVHDITNTQTILDAPHADLRRARACGQSLIPTTTGSAKALTYIFPELKGKLDGHAIRVPLANASLTDCVLELNQKTTKEDVNELLKDAAENELKGILGYEEKPLVSVDYKTDPRSGIIDAPSTMVVNDTQLKLYVWYDNEWGYANRTAELVRMVGLMDLEA